MKRHIILVIVLLVIGLFIAFSAAAHPYEGPRPIYTNIPKHCFSQGRLTCTQLHPVFNGPGTIANPAD
jgi:hypothetical protein